MQFPKKIKLVVTGSRQQFLQWCNKNNLSPTDPFVRYAHAPRDLVGYDPANVEVVYHGTYWNSPVLGCAELEVLSANSKS